MSHIADPIEFDYDKHSHRYLCKPPGISPAVKNDRAKKEKAERKTHKNKRNTQEYSYMDKRLPDMNDTDPVCVIFHFGLTSIRFLFHKFHSTIELYRFFYCIFVCSPILLASILVFVAFSLNRLMYYYLHIGETFKCVCKNIEYANSIL